MASDLCSIGLMFILASGLSGCNAHLKPVKEAAKRCGKQALSAAVESLRICAEEEAGKLIE